MQYIYWDLHLGKFRQVLMSFDRVQQYEADGSILLLASQLSKKKTHHAHFLQNDGSNCILVSRLGFSASKCRKAAYFIASSIATATATVAPTIGLLPMPT